MTDISDLYGDPQQSQEVSFANKNNMTSSHTCQRQGQLCLYNCLLSYCLCACIDTATPGLTITQ